MALNICMVNPFFHPYDGGIERRIKAVGKRLSEKHEVNLVTSQLPGTEPFDLVNGIKVHRLPSRFIYLYNPPAVFTPGIEEKIREINPDVIHLHHRWYFQYPWAVSSFLGSIPVVFTWHNMFGEGVGWKRLFSILNDEFFKHYLGKKCDKVICISEYVKRQLSNHGLPEDILEVIYNGIDLQNQSEDSDPKEEDFILYVGRLVSTKGIDVLAESMEEVSTDLIACGAGPRRKKLEEAENVNPYGFVSEEKKKELIRKCKFLVLPSKKESFGIVLLEAMAAGKPVVATRVGGIPEVVGDAGLLVPPEDPEKLRNAINHMLSDDELRHKLGRMAEKRASSFFWENIVPNVENVYEEVLSE